MRVSNILMIVQAVLLVAAIAVSSFMMFFRIRGESASKTGEEVFKSNALMYYIAIASNATALILLGLTKFWCRST